MARSFSGSLDRFTSSVAPLTALPMTVAMWYYHSGIDGAAACVGNLAGSAQCRVTITSANQVSAQSLTSVGITASSTFASSLTSSAWNHIAGVFNSSSSRLAYSGGVAATENTTSIDAGPATWSGLAVACSYTSGSPGAYLLGRVAELGLWDVALTADEMAILNEGVSPLFVRPESLVAYYPLLGRGGNASNEEPWVGGPTLTQNSSPIVVDHPRMVYPSRRLYVPPVAAAGLALPTLSASTYVPGSLTSTGWRPQITAS